ncbi:NADH-quinone oxidoreductase subunit NuoB [Sulfurospirillum oryzae]|uniref:NADH-quinone oxidoreductase subunit NuoB n=1 Tax=Sulfurospirillum oryzae TaxID=2976535 RepID=UPI0021E991ED|nr:NADH-quinone oxidoreductase subunit NuoB [Sulfurospirillum oryzae]
MFFVLLERLRQGYNTSKYPKIEPILSPRFSGVPKITGSCDLTCKACIDVCPTEAIAKKEQSIAIDLGKCIFCDQCVPLCTHNNIQFTHEYRLASHQRSTLLVTKEVEKIGFQLNQQIQKLFKRSLQLRLVSAGGCNACEADLNVLGTPVYDLNRFGISFTASPRHADGIIITGPVTLNMKQALMDTYDALPSPKIVIASGTCAISGGLFQKSDEVCNGVDSLLPVDLYIPGCPPHPYTALNGLLQFLGRV